MAGEVIEDLVKRLHEVFKRPTGEPFPGIEVCHDIVREQGFDGCLYACEFMAQGKEDNSVLRGRSRYPRVLPGVSG